VTTFLALYHGEDAISATLLALTASPEIVSAFAARILAEPVDADDLITLELERGKRRALALVRDGDDEDSARFVVESIDG
jgi:streptomycin 6-kinase